MVVDKKKLESYLESRKVLVKEELNRVTENEKKVALYAMLGVLDSVTEELNKGSFDKT